MDYSPPPWLSVRGDRVERRHAAPLSAHFRLGPLLVLVRKRGRHRHRVQPSRKDAGWRLWALDRVQAPRPRPQRVRRRWRGGAAGYRARRRGPSYDRG